jgi:hypothetical protein
VVADTETVAVVVADFGVETVVAAAVVGIAVRVVPVVLVVP